MMSFESRGDEVTGRAPAETPIRERNMALLLSLFLILLAFFVQMTAVSTKTPSRVDSTLSSITETFGKSAQPFPEGAIAASSGSVIRDLPYLDAVVSAARGSGDRGEVKSSRHDGTLMLRMPRERLFVAHTGVMHLEGAAFARRLAEAMIAGDISQPLRSIEIRLVAGADELAGAPQQTAPAAPIRQAAAFAVALSEAGVNPAAIAASVIAGPAPIVEMRFYSLAPEPGENGANG